MLPNALLTMLGFCSHIVVLLKSGLDVPQTHLGGLFIFSLCLTMTERKLYILAQERLNFFDQFCRHSFPNFEEDSCQFNNNIQLFN